MKFFAFITAAIFSLALGCNKSHDNSKGKRGGSQDPSGDNNPDKTTNTLGDDPRDNGDDPSADPQGLGTLQIDLANAEVIGVAEVSSASKLTTAAPLQGKAPDTIAVATLVAGTQTILAKIDANGELIGLPLPSYTDNPPALRSIKPLGSHGFLLVFDDKTYFPGFDTSTGWVKSDGTIVPFLPNEYDTTKNTYGFLPVQTEMKGDDELWFISEGDFVLWRFDLQSTTFTRFTDDKQKIHRFVITEDGDLYVSGETVDTKAKFLRYLKDNGGFVNLTDDNDSTSLANSLVFGNKLLLGEKIVSADDDVLTHRFLPSGARWLGGAEAQRSRVGSHAVSYGDVTTVAHTDTTRAAFDITGIGAAANPFSDRYKRTSVDYLNGLFFDGTNIVQMNLNDQNKLESALYKSLIHPNGASLNILRVFGPDFGFGEEWLAYARYDDKLAIVPIDAATGLIKSSARLPFDFSTFGTSLGMDIFTQRSAIYKVGDQLVLLYYNHASPDLSLLSRGDDEYDLAPKIQSIGDRVPMDYTVHAVVRNDTLLLAGDDGIYRYAPAVDDDGLTLIGAIPNPILNERTDCGSASYDRLYMGVRQTLTGDYAMVVRLCGTDSTNKEARGPLVYIEMVDDPAMEGWDLHKIREQASSLVYIDLGVPAVEGVSENYPMQTFYDKDGALVFLHRWEYEWHLPDGHSLAPAAPTSEVITKGLFRFGQDFPNDESGVEYGTKWTDQGFLITGPIDTIYRSYRVDITARAEAEITDLQGVQIYGAIDLGEGTLFVNGLDISANSNINATFSRDGALLEKESTSNVKFLQLESVTPSGT